MRLAVIVPVSVETQHLHRPERFGALEALHQDPLAAEVANTVGKLCGGDGGKTLLDRGDGKRYDRLKGHERSVASGHTEDEHKPEAAPAAAASWRARASTAPVRGTRSSPGHVRATPMMRLTIIASFPVRSLPEVRRTTTG